MLELLVEAIALHFCRTSNIVIFLRGGKGFHFFQVLQRTALPWRVSFFPTTGIFDKYVICGYFPRRGTGALAKILATCLCRLPIGKRNTCQINCQCLFIDQVHNCCCPTPHLHLTRKQVTRVDSVTQYAERWWKRAVRTRTQWQVDTWKVYASTNICQTHQAWELYDIYSLGSLHLQYILLAHLSNTYFRCTTQHFASKYQFNVWVSCGHHSTGWSYLRQLWGFIFVAVSNEGKMACINTT